MSFSRTPEGLPSKHSMLRQFVEQKFLTNDSVPTDTFPKYFLVAKDFWPCITKYYTSKFYCRPLKQSNSSLY